jgi:hypothetical protein
VTKRVREQSLTHAQYRRADRTAAHRRLRRQGERCFDWPGAQGSLEGVRRRPEPDRRCLTSSPFRSQCSRSPLLYSTDCNTMLWITQMRARRRTAPSTGLLRECGATTGPSAGRGGKEPGRRGRGGRSACPRQEGQGLAHRASSIAAVLDAGERRSVVALPRHRRRDSHEGLEVVRLRGREDRGGVCKGVIERESRLCKHGTYRGGHNRQREGDRTTSRRCRGSARSDGGSALDVSNASAAPTW